MPIDLYPHQAKASKEIHNGCIVDGGVGTGKSRTALYYFYTHEVGGRLCTNGVGVDEAPRAPMDLYIITTAKKRDSVEWVHEASNFRISTKRDNSIGGIQLTVDSWNNVINYKDVTDAFFIFDEQRLVGSGAWVKAFLEIARKNRWIMLSATPGDTWMDYAPVFIANGWYRNRTDFIRSHVVYSNHTTFPKIDRYVDTGILEQHRQDVLVKMPFSRHTKRHIETVVVDHDVDLFGRVWKDRWHVYEQRPLRDVAEMFIVGRKVVNSDPARLNGVMRVLEKHPKLIVFYNFDYELEMLRTLGPVLDIPMTEWNGHKHESIPEGDRWIYLVQYTAGAEGWNCTTTDAEYFYSLNYSYKIWEQAQGRIDRLNTPYTDLHYFVARSTSKIDQLIWKAITTKRSFNEGSASKSWAPFPTDTAESNAQQDVANAQSALDAKYSAV